MVWGRVGAVVAVVMASVMAWYGVRPDPAFAYYDAITTADDWTIVNEWLKQPTPPTAVDSLTKQKPIQIGKWIRYRTLLGGMGGAAPISTVGVVGLGLVVGWEIGHATGLSEWAYGRTAGQGSPSTVAAITGEQWTKVSLSSGTSPTAAQAGCAGSTCDAYRLSITGSGGGCPNFYATSWTNAFNITYGCDATENANMKSVLDAVAASSTWEHTTNWTDGSGLAVQGYYFPAEGEGLAGKINWTQHRAYNSASDAGIKTATISSSPHESDVDRGSAAGVAIETSIEDDELLGPEIGTILHPTAPDTGADTETQLLPQPKLNETYVQYRTRLRSIGYLGTITLHENVGAEIETEFGPKVVTDIETATTTLDLLDPWPEPPPTIVTPGEDTDVTISYNPDTSDYPAPGDPGSAEDPPPGNAPPPGGGGTINVGDCSCPAPDFSPISDIDYGDKFPFAIVTISDGLLGTTLFASADAPEFDFDFTSFEAGDFGPYNLGHYDVDLEVFDDYAGLMRTLMSWAIWVGGLYWFGSRWLGFHGSGDPGEVVDEAWTT